MIKNKNWANILLITAIGFTVTLLLTYPLIKGLKSYYPVSGDYASNGWVFWYVFDSLKNIGTIDLQTFYNSYQFYPFGNTLAQLDFQFFTSAFIFSPIFFLTRDLIFSVNSTVFLGILLTFLSCYFSINYLVKNRISSIIGAIIFTFSPPVMAHFIPGHIEYLTRFFIPPLLVSSIVFFQKPKMKTGLLFFTFLILNLITSLQMFAFSLVFIFIIFIYFFVKELKEKRILNWLKEIIKPSLMFAITIPIILKFYGNYLNFGFKREVELLTVYSPKIYDFFIGLPENIFLGSFYKSLEPLRLLEIPGYGVNYGERTLFPGFIALTAILFFILKRVKNIPSEVSKVLGLSLIATYILALGPFITLFDETFTLPYYYLYNSVSFLQFIRTPGRIYLVGIFFIALITSFFFNQIIKSIKNKKYLRMFLITLTLLFLLFEYKNSLKFNAYNDKFPAYNLRGQKVVFLPFAEEDKGNYQSRYLTIMTKSNFMMVNGATGSMPQGFDIIRENLQTLKFDAKFRETLKRLDVRYVIIDSNKLNDFLEIKNDFERRENIINDLSVYNDSDWIILDMKRISDNL